MIHSRYWNKMSRGWQSYIKTLINNWIIETTHRLIEAIRAKVDDEFWLFGDNQCIIITQSPWKSAKTNRFFKEVYKDWIDVKIDQADTDDKEENSEVHPSSKEIVEALTILRWAVQNRVNEKALRNIICTKPWSSCSYSAENIRQR